jgi:hypothetical protein
MNVLLDRFRWWGDRPLISLAACFAFLALCLTAGDHIEAAGQLLSLAAVFGFISLGWWSYRRLPADGRQFVFSRAFVRNSFLGSFAGAALLTCTYWFAAWKVDLRLPAFILKNFGKLDFVPSAFSLLLPHGWRSNFHQYFRLSGTYCFPGPFWWESMRYFRAAIPAYGTAFLLLACLARLIAASIRSSRTRSG